MGREIRRVPPDWVHPKKSFPDGEGWQPLYDMDFDAAMSEWMNKAQAWLNGGMEEVLAGKYAPDTDAERARWRREPMWAFTQYGNSPPDPAFHRPKWTPEDATAFQVYETVSEGTPCSPVLKNREELVEWLAQDHPDWPGLPGYSVPSPTQKYGGWKALTREGAKRFVDAGSAPSMILDEKGLRSGTQAVAEDARHDGD